MSNVSEQIACTLHKMVIY